MAQIAAVQLKDSANANKQYDPERVQTGSYAAWVNRAQGTFAGVKRLSTTRKPSTAKQPMEKQLLKISHPSINGTTGEIQWTNYYLGEIGVHRNASLAEKQELMYSIAAAMGLTAIQLQSTTGEVISG